MSEEPGTRDGDSCLGILILRRRRRLHRESEGRGDKKGYERALRVCLQKTPGRKLLEKHEGHWGLGSWQPEEGYLQEREQLSVPRFLAASKMGLLVLHRGLEVTAEEVGRLPASAMGRG